MAEPDDEIPKINPSEVETLINKIEQSNLDEQDKRMVRLRQASLAPLSRRAKLACRSLTTMFAISPSTVNTPPPSPRPVRLRVDCALA